MMPFVLRSTYERAVAGWEQTRTSRDKAAAWAVEERARAGRGENAAGLCDQRLLAAPAASDETEAELTACEAERDRLQAEVTRLTAELARRSERPRGDDGRFLRGGA